MYSTFPHVTVTDDIITEISQNFRESNVFTKSNLKSNELFSWINGNFSLTWKIFREINLKENSLAALVNYNIFQKLDLSHLSLKVNQLP